MPIHCITVAGVGSREPDHSPPDHVAVTTIHRVAEETFYRHLQQHVEEHGRGYAVEIMRAGLEGLEVGVLGFSGKIMEGRAAPLVIATDGSQAGAKEFGRRERQLVTLSGRA